MQKSSYEFLSIAVKVLCHKLSGIITITRRRSRSASCVTSADEIIFHLGTSIKTCVYVRKFSLFFFWNFVFTFFHQRPLNLELRLTLSLFFNSDTIARRQWSSSPIQTKCGRNFFGNMMLTLSQGSELFFLPETKLCVKTSSLFEYYREILNRPLTRCHLAFYLKTLYCYQTMAPTTVVKAIVVS